MDTIKIGNTVKWLGNRYEVIEVIGSKVLLKQKFSIGTVLAKPVDIADLEIDK